MAPRADGDRSAYTAVGGGTLTTPIRSGARPYWSIRSRLIHREGAMTSSACWQKAR